MEWVDTLKGSNTQAMLKRSKPLATDQEKKDCHRPIRPHKSCSCLPQVGAASAARNFLRIFPFPY
jgi:hypothetical protein